MKKFVLTILAISSITMVSSAATIGSYANLPAGKLGEFKFGKLSSADISGNPSAPSLVLRGTSSDGFETVCLITKDLAAKTGTDLSATLLLLNTTPSAEVLCQNSLKADGSLSTDSFSISLQSLNK